MAAAISELLARFGSLESAESLARGLPPALSTGWPELDAILPDGGLPQGVIELTARGALGGGTSIALAAMRAAHHRDPRAWCAWLDHEGTLYAPALEGAGIDLARLLVVRPPSSELPRVAVRAAASGAFDVIAVDFAGKGGCEARGAWRPEIFVRKLAVLGAERGTSLLLLTDSLAPRAQPWPVALRLELERAPNSISVRVTKDKRGRVGLIPRTVPLASRPLGATTSLAG